MQLNYLSTVRPTPAQQDTSKRYASTGTGSRSRSSELSRTSEISRCKPFIVSTAMFWMHVFILNYHPRELYCPLPRRRKSSASILVYSTRGSSRPAGSRRHTGTCSAAQRRRPAPAAVTRSLSPAFVASNYPWLMAARACLAARRSARLSVSAGTVAECSVAVP